MVIGEVDDKAKKNIKQIIRERQDKESSIFEKRRPWRDVIRAPVRAHRITV